MNPQEYMKQLGRDGSYLECDVCDLFNLIDAPVFPKMLVLKAARLEISDAKQMQQLKAILQEYGNSSGCAEMSQEQMGFYVFREIFEAGLSRLANRIAGGENVPFE